VVGQAIAQSTTHRPRGGYDLGVGFGEVDAAAALDAAGRLAGLKTAGAGLDSHYTLGDAGPERVAHHNAGFIAAYASLTVVGLIVAVACALIAFRRRPPGGGPGRHRQMGLGMGEPPRPGELGLGGPGLGGPGLGGPGLGGPGLGGPGLGGPSRPAGPPDGSGPQAMW
jgi:hypothetical protein